MTYSPEDLLVYARLSEGDRLPHFPEKLAAAQQVLAFDMSDAIPAGVTLQTATVNVVCAANTDATPNAIINGAIGLDGLTGLVTVPVRAGNRGVFYIITVSCTTDSPFYAPVMIAVLPVI